MTRLRRGEGIVGSQTRTDCVWEPWPLFLFRRQDTGATQGRDALATAGTHGARRKPGGIARPSHHSRAHLGRKGGSVARTAEPFLLRTKPHANLNCPHRQATPTHFAGPATPSASFPARRPFSPRWFRVVRRRAGVVPGHAEGNMVGFRASSGKMAKNLHKCNCCD